MLVSLSLDSVDLPRLIIYVLFLLVAVGLHEYAHAWAATRLGDPTPSEEERLTLNPLAHADPIGTFMMPVMAQLFSFPLLGWGRPVPTQPRRYTRKISMRLGLAFVAAAGPLTNLLLAVLTVVLAAVVARAGALTPLPGELAFDFVALNIVLFVFNLLPIHPLDGGKILSAFLPESLRGIDEFTERFGGMLILGLVIFGGGVLGMLVTPVMSGAMELWKALVAA